MKVRIVESCLLKGKHLHAGSVIDISEQDAGDLAASGRVVKAKKDEDLVDTTPVDEDTPPAKKRGAKPAATETAGE